MSRIKEAIGYESALPDPDVFGMAEQQMEQDQQAAGSARAAAAIERRRPGPDSVLIFMQRTSEQKPAHTSAPL